MPNKTPHARREEYIARINQAIDFIEQFISSDLNLEVIAKAANFSPYHFHRIFSSIVGETLNSFIKRVRVEKASMMLWMNPKYSVTEIAFKCGFSSSQAFARAFKEHFKTTPSEYRDKKEFYSKNRNIQSKNKNAYKIKFVYNETNGRPTIHYKSNHKLNMKLEIKDLPDVTVAYVRHMGPYKGDSQLFENLFNKLMAWAGPRDLIKPDTKFYSLYHDDPKITEDAKLRTDVCMSISEDTKVEGEIGKQVLKGGKYALARFEITDPKDYGNAWTQVYKDWLPESGYHPDNKPPFEWYQNDPKKDPEGKHIFDICVPVKPL